MRRSDVKTWLERIGKLAAACEGISVSQDGLTAGELDAVEEQLYTYENSLITDGLHCLNEEESRGILHALDGKYLPAGTAGDVKKEPGDSSVGAKSGTVRSTADTDKNRMGARGKGGKTDGGEVLQRDGKIPDTTAVILWGLETSRSQGGDDWADPVLSGASPEDGESEL